MAPPIFLASKIEAFKNRGSNNNGEYDGRTSDDFADIVFVLENRSAIWEEIKTVTPFVQQFLKEEFNKIIANPYIDEWVDVHVSFNYPPATGFIIQQLKELLH